MLLVLLFTLCYRLHSKKFSNFQIIFALYLYHEDARRRVIDSLYFLSLTLSYKSILRHLSRLTENAQNRIKSIERLFITMLIYDNLDYAEDRRDERVDEIRTFRSITSALLFEIHELDAISLIKNMWNSILHLLSVTNLARNFFNVKLDYQVKFRHIWSFY